jgi:hypothetical protein
MLSLIAVAPLVRSQVRKGCAKLDFWLVSADFRPIRQISALPGKPLQRQRRQGFAGGGKCSPIAEFRTAPPFW